MQDKPGAPGRAHVVYYLCRNGKVEPPHMIDVVHSAQGLRLRDVKQRLTALRGSRMPVMYAWSFKRIYKNASLWQDVSSDDFILPISTGEYVLKGSEIVEGKSSKSYTSTKPPAESLQRKFWGAESWLPTSFEGKPRMETPLYITYRKDYEQVKLSSAKAEDLAGNTELSGGAWDRHSSSVLRDQGVQSGGEEVKVYAIKATAVADHGCDAATQTDEIRRRKQGCPEPARDSAEASTAAAASAPPCIQSQPKLAVQETGSPPSTKKLGKFRRVPSQDKDGDINARGTKNASASWVLFHVLSYCGGLDTKARQGGTSPVSKEYGEWKDAPEATSSSDTSRDTRQSRSSDSLPSSDASDEAGSHKISAFVDVKEMVVTTRKTSPSRNSVSGGKNFSFLSRQYGRLSKSDTYSSRNVKYDIDNGQQVPAGASDDRQEAFKFELSCYRAE